MKIELDRKNEVYYPGETVTGSVIVEDADVEKLEGKQGLFFEYYSTARSNWTAEEKGGSNKEPGDSSVKYTSETCFQSITRALCASSYQTGKLSTTGSQDGANYQGEMLNFDNYPGSGDLHLPCTEKDKTNLKVIVAALDAEVLIDIPNFVNTKSSQLPFKSFYLTTTVGNMTKGPVKLSAKFEDYETVFPGDTDTSQHKPYCLVLKVHQLKGVKPGSKDVIVKVRRADSNGTPKEETFPVIAKQKRRFPFSIPLRDDAPGSANFKFGKDLSGVTHRLWAFVEGCDPVPQHASDDDTIRVKPVSSIITILPNRPIPRNVLLSPYSMETGDQPVMRFGCCATGKMVVSIKLCLGRLVYAPGEVIDLTGSAVSNNGKEDQRMQIVLRAFVEQKGISSSDSSSSTSKQPYVPTKTQYHDTILFEGVIPAHKDHEIISNMRSFSWIRVPTVHPSYSGVYLSADGARRESACLRWAYTLEIRLPDYGSAGGFHCRAPLLVAAVPPYTQEINAQRNLRPNPRLTDPWSIFDHAVSSSANRQCQSAPLLRSPDDFQGRLFPTTQTAPVWIGNGNSSSSNNEQESDNDTDFEQWIAQGSHRHDLAVWAETGDDAKYPHVAERFYRAVSPVYAGPSFDRNRSLEEPAATKSK